MSNVTMSGTANIVCTYNPNFRLYCWTNTQIWQVLVVRVWLVMLVFMTVMLYTYTQLLGDNKIMLTYQISKEYFIFSVAQTQNIYTNNCIYTPYFFPFVQRKLPSNTSLIQYQALV